MSGHKLVVAIGLFAVLLFCAGCSYCKAPVVRTAEAPRHVEPPPPQAITEVLPVNAKPGECWVKVFVPEQYKTTQETVLVRPASERLETIPAQYEWVEETILVKDASSVLEEVPAEFAWEERTIETEPAHTNWHVEKRAACVNCKDQQPAEEMYCLKTKEPTFQTVRHQVLVKPVTTRETIIPAEYQTVRRQKLVAPATTRRIPIPAEYASVDKVMKVADSRVEWQRVDCIQESRTEATSTEDAKLVRSNQP